MPEEKPVYQQLLEELIKAFVNHPEEVKVERNIDEMGVLLTVKAHPQDVGLIIGRKGSTARAIRLLMKIIGLKNHARVNVKIEEPQSKKSNEAQTTQTPSFEEVIKEIKEE